MAIQSGSNDLLGNPVPSPLCGLGGRKMVLALVIVSVAVMLHAFGHGLSTEMTTLLLGVFTVFSGANIANNKMSTAAKSDYAIAATIDAHDGTAWPGDTVDAPHVTQAAQGFNAAIDKEIEETFADVIARLNTLQEGQAVANAALGRLVEFVNTIPRPPVGA